MKTSVKINVEDFIDLLETRRQNVEKWYGWVIPQIVWDYYLEYLRECGGGDDPDKNNPSYIVDNIAANGDYGSFDDYKREGESDEDFIARMEGDFLFIDENERFICLTI